MPVDLMLDVNGDLVATAANDFALVSGTDEVNQRIKTHIKVQLGSYQLDPSLGSTANTLLRVSTSMAVTQLPLIIKEALSQMSDIFVQDVETWVDADDPRKVDFTVTYTLTGNVAGDPLTFTDFLVVTS